MAIWSWETWRPHSALAASGIPAGATILGVDGHSLEDLSPGELRARFRDHPLAAGQVLDYRTADGQRGQSRLGDRLSFVQDVKLLGVKFHDLTDKQLDAEIEVAVRAPPAGEYRISDAEGHASLGDWRKLDRNSIGLLAAAPPETHRG